MKTRRLFVLSAASLGLASSALAQFTGPSVQGQAATVAEALNLRVGRYVTLEGNVVAHQREDYYSFQDATGTIRVEIPPERFGGQEVGPNDRVRIMGEIDTGSAGRYIWVKSLQKI